VPVGRLHPFKLRVEVRPPRAERRSDVILGRLPLERDVADDDIAGIQALDVDPCHLWVCGECVDDGLRLPVVDGDGDLHSPVTAVGHISPSALDFCHLGSRGKWRDRAKRVRVLFDETKMKVDLSALSRDVRPRRLGSSAPRSIAVQRLPVRSHGI